MTLLEKFGYQPGEHECEQASNAYVMSLVALMAGMPLPIVNLIASFIFYLGNRKGTYYVRWYSAQALVIQATLFFMNSYGMYWSLSIVFGGVHVTNQYIAYMLTILSINLVEFISVIYTAIRLRNGGYVHWWFYSAFTDIICKP